MPSRSLISRLDKLEERAIPDADAFDVIVVSFVTANSGKPAPEGRLLGYHPNNLDAEPVYRTEEESDAALLERAKAQARELKSGGIPRLFEVREPVKRRAA